MKIDGIEVMWLSDETGKPIKTKLPDELKSRMRTENQWLDAGYLLKENAVGYEMHASYMSLKTFTYYLDSDVKCFSEASPPHNCMGCQLRVGRWCDVAGDYISANKCCSEWSPIVD